MGAGNRLVANHCCQCVTGLQAGAGGGFAGDFWFGDFGGCRCFLGWGFFGGSFFGCCAGFDGHGFAERSFHSRGLAAGGSSGFARWKLGRCKLEVDLVSFLVPRQHGLEGATRAHGHELVEQIGFAGFQQFDHLLAFNRLLQDHLAAFEVAAWGGLLERWHHFVAHIVFTELEHHAAVLCAALGTLAQGLLGAEVLDFARLGIFVVAKVKLQLVVFGFLVKLDDHFGRERPARFGAKTIEWADLFVA